jgi:DNA modification methylase
MEPVMFLQGDSLAVLKAIKSESIDCCVTSPPYWGLRDYGVDGQIGLESTPDAFVARLVDVFREVRRVLKTDGTCWVNLGDSYASQGGSQVAQTKWQVEGASDGQAGGASRTPPSGLKPKDLCGIPWRVAFALQADGWWLRQDIIWHKPNPMPESVRDRCTKAHEYVFLLTKAERYWWDAEAMKEPCSDDMVRRSLAGHTRGANGKLDPSRCDANTLRGERSKVLDVSRGRNRRSVWTIATQPTPEAHFATFPLTLPELCLRAGCRVGGIVLDPFNGAGTTGIAALKNGRRYIGIELKPEYIEISKNRMARKPKAQKKSKALPVNQTQMSFWGGEQWSR